MLNGNGLDWGTHTSNSLVHVGVCTLFTPFKHKPLLPSSLEPGPFIFEIRVRVHY